MDDAEAVSKKGAGGYTGDAPGPQPAQRISVTAMQMGGQTYELSVDPSGSIMDLVDAVDEARRAATDMSEDAWEDRWINNITVLANNDGEMLNTEYADSLGQVGVKDGDYFSIFFKEATEEQKQARGRRSRLRQVMRGGPRLVPSVDASHAKQQIARYSKNFVADLAAALTEGRQVSGHHTLHCKFQQCEWSEDGWSWTLVRNSTDGPFLWRHQERGTGLETVESFPTEEEFIDFWTQLSDSSSCSYTAILIYRDCREAFKLEGFTSSKDLARLLHA